MNPTLVEKVLERTAGKSLEVSGPYGTLKNADAETELYRRKYPWGPRAPMIRLSPGITTSLVASARNPRYARIQEVQYTLFHEFLHYARMDSNSSAVHNRLRYVNSDYEKDVIYACAAQAYPDFPLKRRSTSAGTIFYGNSKLACRVCAAAHGAAPSTETLAYCDEIQESDLSWMSQ